MRQIRGFTVVELLVSISIIVFMSSILFFNFPKFRQSTVMNSAARDLSLALRDAQVRATSISLSAGPTAKNYAIYTTTNTASNKNKTYILFSDKNENNVYDATSDVIVNTGRLPGGIYIKAYELPASLSGCDISTSDQMVVIYRRPDPTTDVLDNTGSGVTKGACNEYGPFVIQLSSQDDSEARKIVVWRTGQVSIQ